MVRCLRARWGVSLHSLERQVYESDASFSGAVKFFRHCVSSSGESSNARLGFEGVPLVSLSGLRRLLACCRRSSERSTMGSSRAVILRHDRQVTVLRKVPKKI